MYKYENSLFNTHTFYNIFVMALRQLNFPLCSKKYLTTIFDTEASKIVRNKIMFFCINIFDSN